jgi:hypothetical protein
MNVANITDAAINHGLKLGFQVADVAGNRGDSATALN